MTLSQYRDNWNYMYEWKRGIDSQWFPCHILINDNQTDNEHICIYTRNGTILKEHPENVRRMAEKDYCKQREQYISLLEKHYKTYGFHETLKEDLKLLMKS